MSIDAQMEIENMSYTDFIVLLKETNRCPGGKRTVQRIRELLHIDENTKMLEVGSNTGFTSFEFAHISPAKLFGIDVSEECVRIANEAKVADTALVQDRVSFQVGSSYSIPFVNDYFDIIMAGGATGFMSDTSGALQEYFRVLKNWGFLVMTPLVYHTAPPQEIIDLVSEVLGAQIKPMQAHDWTKKVLNENRLWELCRQENYTLSPRTDEDIDVYISYFMEKDHIKILSTEDRRAIEKRWRSHIQIFNENHKYLGYAIQIYRKRMTEEEPEFFRS